MGGPVARRALGPGGALRRRGILRLESGSPGTAHRPHRVPERVQAFLRDQDPTVGSMTVEEVRLTESRLGPEGPEYRTVTAVPL